MENQQEDESAAADLLRDRFRLSTISIVQSEAKQNNMEISEPIVACISDLAFKYAEHVAKDLELFAAHGGRKTVNMKDVILCAHRNEHLADLLRSFGNDLKDKDPQSEKKRKKKSRKDDNAASSVLHIPDDT
ncbi:protein MHF1 homolog [Daucus carota subsp. sativus]|uniref:protein MHF1 homolog n=1 Tax=Daucus carota subsp. sativus TaxID=79200 RepID=UPI0007F01598|nr:PREDICTED: MHF histone-fold complex subunit 1 [Daucus carota subsp. sativus]